MKHILELRKCALKNERRRWLAKDTACQMPSQAPDYKTNGLHSMAHSIGYPVQQLAYTNALLKEDNVSPMYNLLQRYQQYLNEKNVFSCSSKEEDQVYNYTVSECPIYDQLSVSQSFSNIPMTDSFEVNLESMIPKHIIPDFLVQNIVMPSDNIACRCGASCCSVCGPLRPPSRYGNEESYELPMPSFHQNYNTTSTNTPSYTASYNTNHYNTKDNNSSAYNYEAKYEYVNDENNPAVCMAPPVLFSPTAEPKSQSFEQHTNTGHYVATVVDPDAARQFEYVWKGFPTTPGTENQSKNPYYSLTTELSVNKEKKTKTNKSKKIKHIQQQIGTYQSTTYVANPILNEEFQNQIATKAKLKKRRLDDPTSKLRYVYKPANPFKEKQAQILGPDDNQTTPDKFFSKKNQHRYQSYAAVLNSNRGSLNAKTQIVENANPTKKMENNLNAAAVTSDTPEQETLEGKNLSLTSTLDKNHLLLPATIEKSKDIDIENTKDCFSNSVSNTSQRGYIYKNKSILKYKDTEGMDDLSRNTHIKNRILLEDKEGGKTSLQTSYTTPIMVNNTNEDENMTKDLNKMYEDTTSSQREDLKKYHENILHDGLTAPNIRYKYMKVAPPVRGTTSQNITLHKITTGSTFDEKLTLLNDNKNTETEQQTAPDLNSKYKEKYMNQDPTKLKDTDSNKLLCLQNTTSNVSDGKNINKDSTANLSDLKMKDTLKHSAPTTSPATNLDTILPASTKTQAEKDVEATSDRLNLSSHTPGSYQDLVQNLVGGRTKLYAQTQDKAKYLDENLSKRSQEISQYLWKSSIFEPEQTVDRNKNLAGSLARKKIETKAECLDINLLKYLPETDNNFAADETVVRIENLALQQTQKKKKSHAPRRIADRNKISAPRRTADRLYINNEITQQIKQKEKVGAKQKYIYKAVIPPVFKNIKLDKEFSQPFAIEIIFEEGDANETNTLHNKKMEKNLTEHNTDPIMNYTSGLVPTEIKTDDVDGPLPCTPIQPNMASYSQHICGPLRPISKYNLNKPTEMQSAIPRLRRNFRRTDMSNSNLSKQTYKSKIPVMINSNQIVSRPPPTLKTQQIEESEDSQKEINDKEEFEEENLDELTQNSIDKMSKNSVDKVSKTSGMKTGEREATSASDEYEEDIEATEQNDTDSQFDSGTVTKFKNNAETSKYKSGFLDTTTNQFVVSPVPALRRNQLAVDLTEQYETTQKPEFSRKRTDSGILNHSTRVHQKQNICVARRQSEETCFKPQYEGSTCESPVRIKNKTLIEDHDSPSVQVLYREQLSNSLSCDTITPNDKFLTSNLEYRPMEILKCDYFSYPCTSNLEYSEPNKSDHNEIHSLIKYTGESLNTQIRLKPSENIDEISTPEEVSSQSKCYQLHESAKLQESKNNISPDTTVENQPAETRTSKNDMIKPLQNEERNIIIDKLFIPNMELFSETGQKPSIMPDISLSELSSEIGQKPTIMTDTSLSELSSEIEQKPTIMTDTSLSELSSEIGQKSTIMTETSLSELSSEIGQKPTIMTDTSLAELSSEKGQKPTIMTDTSLSELSSEIGQKPTIMTDTLFSDLFSEKVQKPTKITDKSSSELSSEIMQKLTTTTHTSLPPKKYASISETVLIDAYQTVRKSAAELKNLNSMEKQISISHNLSRKQSDTNKRTFSTSAFLIRESLPKIRLETAPPLLELEDIAQLKSTPPLVKRTTDATWVLPQNANQQTMPFSKTSPLHVSTCPTAVKKFGKHTFKQKRHQKRLHRISLFTSNPQKNRSVKSKQFFKKIQETVCGIFGAQKTTPKIGNTKKIPPELKEEVKEARRLTTYIKQLCAQMSNLSKGSSANEASISPNPCSSDYSKQLKVMKVMASISLICLMGAIYRMMRFNNELYIESPYVDYEYLNRRSKKSPWENSNETLFCHDNTNDLPSDCTPEKNDGTFEETPGDNLTDGTLLILFPTKYHEANYETRLPEVEELVADEELISKLPKEIKIKVIPKNYDEEDITPVLNYNEYPEDNFKEATVLEDNNDSPKKETSKLCVDNPLSVSLEVDQEY